jgi:hypothetical protein
MTGQAEGIDLHGIEKQPFPSFDESATYIEGCTLNRQQAKELLKAQGFDTVELRGVWMRWVSGEEATSKSGGEMDECWLECKQSDSGALPFWKDAP